MRKRREYTKRLYDLIDNWPQNYRTEIQRISGPAESDVFYWHLYYKGQKINGGLIETRREDAQDRADAYRLSHTRDVILASHVWDYETATWIPKHELNIM